MLSKNRKWCHDLTRTVSVTHPAHIFWWELIENTVKPVLSGHSKIDKTNILMINGSLMKVKSIAECSPWSILQYFWPALSDSWSWKLIYGLFESGCFRQVLLYSKVGLSSA